MSAVSKHGDRRLRQRAGLPKSATAKSFESALEHGLRAVDARGKLRRYLDKLGHHESGAKPIIYANTVFIVGAKNTLVTAWELPSWLRADAQRQAKKGEK